jgi:N-acetylmuramic acid 6-phosphate etherase
MDLDTFLREAEQFRLGDLPTEAANPLTSDLSRLCREDPAQALGVLRRIDLLALDQLQLRLPRLHMLATHIRETWARGGRLFLVGCGATGRLSISLEVLWRQQGGTDVFGFMAGGDLALVHSIEKFEDHPEFGARQLTDLGFRDGDLLVATTEGGETPFVIGATEEAARISRQKPWFLYCNPDDVLCRIVERSRNVIENPAIEKCNLSVGPMSLSGSTRMQASTVLMLGVGMAMWDQWDSIEHLQEALLKLDLPRLASLAEHEHRIYAEGGLVGYEATRHGITIVTDTTERAPTFSLLSFENDQDSGRAPALAYFHLPGTETAEVAWSTLLEREPRPIEWPEVAAVTGGKRLLGFDFSDHGQRRAKSQKTFRVEEGITLDLDGEEVKLDVEGLSLLEEHLLLKLVLNSHSAVVMGRLGRFENNLMTYVRPSNMKLIDRVIRYVRQLAGTELAYADVARAVFAEMETLPADQPIVLQTLKRLQKAGVE